jgi:hypothetical protein
MGIERGAHLLVLRDLDIWWQLLIQLDSVRRHVIVDHHR